MNEVIHQIVTLPPQYLTLIVLVCLLGFAFVKTMAPIAGLAYVTLPFMLVGALLARFAMLDSPLIAQLDPGPGIVVTTAIGMIAAVVGVVVVVRIGMIVHDLLGKRPELLDKALLEKHD